MVGAGADVQLQLVSTSFSAQLRWLRRGNRLLRSTSAELAHLKRTTSHNSLSFLVWLACYGILTIAEYGERLYSLLAC